VYVFKHDFSFISITFDNISIDVSCVMAEPLEL